MAHLLDENKAGTFRSLPAWFRQDVPDMHKIAEMKKMFRASKLFTVCESARCPNMGKCWGQGVATFMILGEVCTRACRFCAVRAGRPLTVDHREPDEVARAVDTLGLRYVVVTSVARDDLADEGAGQFARTITAIRRLRPQTKVEVLVPDFSDRQECLETVGGAAPEVFSHNIETVRRLSPHVRPQAGYERSLEVLQHYRRLCPKAFVKTSLMVGLGETDEEVEAVMRDVRQAGCDILTIGQYLAPTQRRRHLPVQKFVSPEKFSDYRERGQRMGFKHVMSGPLVRSSFIAEEGYRACLADRQTDASG